MTNLSPQMSKIADILRSEGIEGEHGYDIMLKISKALTVEDEGKIIKTWGWLHETANQIALRKIEEYVEKGLTEKYNKGAPHGWENGIAYKYELEILKDCTDWLQQEDEDEPTN